MFYEHRQSPQAIGNHPGIFVTRVGLPAAEAEYRNGLFQGRNPVWKIPTHDSHGVPLDNIVLADPGFLQELGETIANKPSDYPRDTFLYGFHETSHMLEIAGNLGIAYYGNPEFAAWAGTKIGLSKFAQECDVTTPDEEPIFASDDLMRIATRLKDKGYQRLVVKVNNSTGGMGHIVSKVEDILEADDGTFDTFMPEEFMPEEGGVVQGWIEEPAGRLVLNIFVDFDGSYSFTQAAQKVLTPGGQFVYLPIDEKYIDQLLKEGHKLAAGYVRHKAWGPHSTNFIALEPSEAQQLGFDECDLLYHDENTRCGANEIAKSWVQETRLGQVGIGWRVSQVKVPQGTKIENVIHTLRGERMLIEKSSPNAHGVIIYNGMVLDSGYENKFYAIAVSKQDDPDEAADIMNQARNLFK